MNIFIFVKNHPESILHLLDCQVQLDDGEKNTEPLYVIDFVITQKNHPNNKITDVVMFDGASNVQFGGKMMKIHYPKLKVMRGVEQNVSLFFNYVSKIPIVNQMITAHKEI